MGHQIRHLHAVRAAAVTLLAGLASCVLPALAATACPALLQHTVPRLQDEKPINLCDYAGQVVLVVNTASYCGYTPQYKALEALNERYRKRGLIVLGFPSNDFGGQEPGANAEIAAFCENTFNVKFPMFTKTQVKSVRGSRIEPLYAELAARTGESPQWNFHKYLIGRDGSVVISHASAVEPDSARFIKDVERLLDVK